MYIYYVYIFHYYIPLLISRLCNLRSVTDHSLQEPSDGVVSVEDFSNHLKRFLEMFSCLGDKQDSTETQACLTKCLNMYCDASTVTGKDYIWRYNILKYSIYIL